MTTTSQFWDALAPHHAAVEDNYFDLRSVRRLLDALQPPVLIVGGGQGLIVDELRKQGLQCDGLDLSPQMVRYAKLRRGIELIEADAAAMPFTPHAYGTVVYATGVIDFMSDEDQIRTVLTEGRRVVRSSGNIYVAFYRVGPVQERFLAKVGLLRNDVLLHKQSLELYLLNPIQMVSWVRKRAGTGHLRALGLIVWLAARSTMREKAMTFRVQKIFRAPETARALLEAAPEQQPYRTEAEIRNLFRRLAIPLREFRILPSCYIAGI